MKSNFAYGFLFSALLMAQPVVGQVVQPEYYERLSNDLRVGLQRSLLWTGHFSGVSDGVFGKTSLEAVRRYQASVGAPVTGFLTKQQAVVLIRAAAKIENEFGYRLFSDPYTGATIGLPEKFVRFKELTKRGSQFVSATGAVDMTTMRIPQSERTLEELYRLHLSRQGRTVTYKVYRGDWFVVAGHEGGKRFYVRAHTYSNDIRGFAISYPEQYAGVFDRLTIAMSSDFKPDSSGLSVAQARMDSFAVERAFAAPAAAPVVVPPQIATAPSIPTIPVPREQRTTLSPPQPAQSAPHTGGPVEKLDGKISTGTSFSVSKDGYFLTNAHVVNGCTAVSVGTYGSAKVVDRDSVNDLALLKIDATIPVKPLPLSNASPKLGEEVIAMGYPLQDVLQNGLNATRGDISSLAGIGGDSRMVQFTAAVQPGNSGGPLINGRGEVVGIVTSKLNAGKIASATGDIPQSVNFAIRPELVDIYLRRFGVIPFHLAADSPKPAERHELIAAARDAVNIVICKG